ncbi:uncharacterized protein Tco025E_09575 [Trypanosoma conorhini]|uniref:Uncharacterized protein n=1 Tax=Trypanosoma conorhini TaxID=83891 RepID=A0A3R7JXX4_9TRYP|nr:uncharacterized protein Tco025E_09575 [Trypanosoma conorhini]RNE98632.1 hypothetical protein Tco025E_09575 [Trypanosoma conorhini]
MGLGAAVGGSADHACGERWRRRSGARTRSPQRRLSSQVPPPPREGAGDGARGEAARPAGGACRGPRLFLRGGSCGLLFVRGASTAAAWRATQQTNLPGKKQTRAPSGPHASAAEHRN